MKKLFLSMPGVASAAGCGAAEFWRSLVNGDNGGLRRVKTFSGVEFFAGKIGDEFLSQTGAKFDMRVIQIEDLALNQIAEAVERAREKYGASRVAVCVGTCDNGSECSVAAHREYFSAGAFPAAYSLEAQSADYPATYAKEKFGLEGPALAFATACSSSGSAIAKAAELIRAGVVDAAIAGGADVASDTVLLGFNSLEAVSPQKTNPFSKNRSGITIGEAAAFFVLAKDKDVVCGSGASSGEGAGNAASAASGSTNASGATRATDVCVELLGVGESSDASHMTAPLADGSGALSAMRTALNDAALTADKIDYVNMHGTGTHLNDAMEAKAMCACFGGASGSTKASGASKNAGAGAGGSVNALAVENAPPPASSTKPLTGHTLGASSAVELAACYLAIVNNAGKPAGEAKLPLHIYDGEYDNEILPVNLVTKNSKINSDINICMSNSFGFGGCNVSLIIGKA